MDVKLPKNVIWRKPLFIFLFQIISKLSTLHFKYSAGIEKWRKNIWHQFSTYSLLLLCTTYTDLFITLKQFEIVKLISDIPVPCSRAYKVYCKHRTLQGKRKITDIELVLSIRDDYSSRLNKNCQYILRGREVVRKHIFHGENSSLGFIEAVQCLYKLEHHRCHLAHKQNSPNQDRIKLMTLED